MLDELHRRGLGGTQTDDEDPFQPVRFLPLAERDCLAMRSRLVDENVAPSAPGSKGAIALVVPSLEKTGGLIALRQLGEGLQHIVEALVTARCRGARLARGGVELRLNATMLEEEHGGAGATPGLLDRICPHSTTKGAAAGMLAHDVYRTLYASPSRHPTDDATAEFCEVCRPSPIWKALDRWQRVVFGEHRWRTCDASCPG